MIKMVGAKSVKDLNLSYVYVMVCVISFSYVGDDVRLTFDDILILLIQNV